MLQFSAITQRQLKQLLDKLKNIRGRHTELVSVYVPPGYNINEISNLVASEAGTAENIKSKTTRKNVTGALERVVQSLKNIRQTPANGLVIFSGNISEKEGISDIQLWMFEPPEPVNQRLYRCDQTFILDPLFELSREKENYGLITLDANSAAVALLSGRRIKVLHSMESFTPGKTRAGGQSAQRYQRVREGLILTWEKELGDIATKQLEQQKDLLGIIIGGPGPLKYDFAEGPYLSEAMKKKIIGIKDIGYAGTEGLDELVERSEDLLKESSVIREKQILQKFMEHLKKDTGLSTYGAIFVRRAMEAGAVDTLIVSESFEDKMKVFGETEDLFATLEDLAKSMGSKYEVVSKETQEGAQFFQLGGIGALLRYRYEG